MERYVKKFKESDHTLVSNNSKNEWANRTFSKELKNLKPSDIVWLQDKKANYQGYYKVNSKNKFETIGSMPQGIPYRILNSAPIFKEQKRYVKKFKEETNSHHYEASILFDVYEDDYEQGEGRRVFSFKHAVKDKTLEGILKKIASVGKTAVDVGLLRKLGIKEM